MQVRFQEWLCNLRFARYSGNRRLAIRLVDAYDGEPVAMASINIPEAELAPNEVFLKGWSENEGMPEALAQAGIVTLTGKQVPTGYVKADVAVLTPETLAEIERQGV